jgi:hypothetical protein
LSQATCLTGGHKQTAPILTKQNRGRLAWSGAYSRHSGAVANEFSVRQSHHAASGRDGTRRRPRRFPAALQARPCFSSPERRGFSFSPTRLPDPILQTALSPACKSTVHIGCRSPPRDGSSGRGRGKKPRRQDDCLLRTFGGSGASTAARCMVPLMTASKRSLTWRTHKLPLTPKDWLRRTQRPRSA